MLLPQIVFANHSILANFPKYLINEGEETFLYLWQKALIYVTAEHVYLLSKSSISKKWLLRKEHDRLWSYVALVSQDPPV